LTRPLLIRTPAPDEAARRFDRLYGRRRCELSACFCGSDGRHSRCKLAINHNVTRQHLEEKKKENEKKKPARIEVLRF
jgi:hypothetical protein